MVRLLLQEFIVTQLIKFEPDRYHNTLCQTIYVAVIDLVFAVYQDKKHQSADYYPYQDLVRAFVKTVGLVRKGDREDGIER
jgi:hypothetical protein